MKLSLLAVDQQCFEISCDKEGNTSCIVFYDIECIFRKSGKNKYLVFCKDNKVLKKCTKIIDEIRDQILFITEDVSFKVGNDFTRLKFKTSDNLPFNKKIYASVCVISISTVFKENGVYYPQYLTYENEEYQS